MAPSNSADPGELAVRLARTMAVARGLVMGGRRIDLSGIDDGIGVLCAKTLDLPHEQARAMVPELRELLAQVDRLSLAMRSAAPDGGAG